MFSVDNRLIEACISERKSLFLLRRETNHVTTELVTGRKTSRMSLITGHLSIVLSLYTRSIIRAISEIKST